MEYPLGSAFGRVQYQNCLFIYQNRIGGGDKNREGTLDYPIIDKNALMYAGSSIWEKRI